jgi:hypothetical protein
VTDYAIIRITAPRTNVAIPLRESFVADELRPRVFPVVEGLVGVEVPAVTTTVFAPVVAAEPDFVPDFEALLAEAEADFEAEAEEEALLVAEAVEESEPMEMVEFPLGTAPPVLMELALPDLSL